MIRGLYSAANGLMAAEQRHEVIANNMANAATAGYKRQVPVQMGFDQIFSATAKRPYFFNADSSPGGGAKVVETFPDYTMGPLRTTGNHLNMALQGPGFFVVDTPDGARFTRSGDFTRSSDGYLVTPQGYRVQSLTGQPIAVDGAEVTIATDGTVTVDGRLAGRLRLVEFETPERLLRTGDSLYQATPEVERAMAEAAGTLVEQGQVEMSNVQLPNEMINMMLGLRAYEANQRVIRAADDTMSRLIEQVGMPS